MITLKTNVRSYIKKQHLEEFLWAYKGVFQEPKGLPPKRELDPEI
jgi:hypothetical protein